MKGFVLPQLFCLKPAVETETRLGAAERLTTLAVRTESGNLNKCCADKCFFEDFCRYIRECPYVRDAKPDETSQT